MKALFPLLMATLLSACAPEPSPAVRDLAVRLATEEDGSTLTKKYRDGYIDCGIRAFSPLPSDQINAALKASDVSAIWAILGSVALDAFVTSCRVTDSERGPPPRK